MSHRLRTIFIWIALAFIAPTAAYAQSAKTKNAQVDFTERLTRTDEIEVCIAEFPLNQDKVCSPEFLEIQEATCICARDLTRSFFNQANIVDPILINIGVQLSMNRETHRLAFDDPDFTFLEYTETQMPLDLNISSEQLDAAIVEAGQLGYEFWASSWLKRYQHRMDVPSCVSLHKLHEEHFPIMGKLPGFPIDAEKKLCKPK